RRVVHHARATHRRRYGRRGQRRRARGPAFSEPHDWLVRPVTCRRGKREVGSTKSEGRNRSQKSAEAQMSLRTSDFVLRASWPGLVPARTVLDNGAVVLAKRASMTPAVAIHLAMRAGSSCDPDDAPGATWLL